MRSRSAALSAFQGVRRPCTADGAVPAAPDFGELPKDPQRILDLPAGFTCRVPPRSAEVMRGEAIGLVRPEPLRGLGRFPRGAIAVPPPPAPSPLTPAASASKLPHA